MAVGRTGPGRGCGEATCRRSRTPTHDASCYNDYTHTTDDVLPALREHGVVEAQITAMSVHNPARYFTGGQE